MLVHREGADMCHPDGLACPPVDTVKEPPIRTEARKEGLGVSATARAKSTCPWMAGSDSSRSPSSFSPCKFPIDEVIQRCRARPGARGVNSGIGRRCRLRTINCRGSASFSLRCEILLQNQNPSVAGITRTVIVCLLCPCRCRRWKPLPYWRPLRFGDRTPAM